MLLIELKIVELIYCDYKYFCIPIYRPVLPSVEPGYLHKLLPEGVPEQPEKWQEVMKDIERFIMPGITNW